MKPRDVFDDYLFPFLPDRVLTSRQLAEEMGRWPTAASNAVSKLVDRGFLCITKVEQHKKIYYKLTTAGKERLENLTIRYNQ
jgi:DNA-binding MarR family transcriptional regulator